ELVRHLALRSDRLNDRDAARFELAQIDEAFGERAQLRVVKPAGHLLAVAGDEGNGCPLVDQPDCSGRLLRSCIDLRGNLRGKGADISSHGSLSRSGGATIVELQGKATWKMCDSTGCVL